jgi:hypothetical protein
VLFSSVDSPPLTTAANTPNTITNGMSIIQRMEDLSSAVSAALFFIKSDFSGICTKQLLKYIFFLVWGNGKSPAVCLTARLFYNGNS